MKTLSINYHTRHFYVLQLSNTYSSNSWILLVGLSELVTKEIQTLKGSNGRLLILTQTHTMHTFFVKLQNDTLTIHKRI